MNENKHPHASQVRPGFIRSTAAPVQDPIRGPGKCQELERSAVFNFEGGQREITYPLREGGTEFNQGIGPQTAM